MRQQLRNLTRPLRRQTGQNILQVGMRIVPVHARRLNQTHDRCRPFPLRSDLAAHRCIDIRFPTYDGMDAWEFERQGKKLQVRVDGQLVFNSTTHIADAAVSGPGIAYLPEDEFVLQLAQGHLVWVLEDWCALPQPPATFPGIFAGR